MLAAWALATSPPADLAHPFGRRRRLAAAGPAAPTPVELVVDGERTLFRVDPAAAVSTQRTTAADGARDRRRRGVLRLEVDDLVHQAAVRVGPHRVDVAHRGNSSTLRPRRTPSAPAQPRGSDGTVVAPMPGTVLAVVQVTARAR